MLTVQVLHKRVNLRLESTLVSNTQNSGAISIIEFGLRVYRIHRYNEHYTNITIEGCQQITLR